MGPPELQPPLPEWEFATVPASHSFMSKRLQECNWLQALEGGIDSSHVSFLHRGALNRDPLFKGARGNQYNLGDLAPVFDVAHGVVGYISGEDPIVEGVDLSGVIQNWDDARASMEAYRPIIAERFEKKRGACRHT